jgi:LPS export ABC transporter protein LptC
LRAHVARFYAGDVTRAEDVQVDFYERGRKVSVLRARNGFVDGDGRLRAQGDVVVTSTEGAVLTTDELYWDRDNGKIRAEGPFRIVEKGEPLSGVGLTTDPDLSLFEIDRDVQGTHVVEPEEVP